MSGLWRQDGFTLGLELLFLVRVVAEEIVVWLGLRHLAGLLIYQIVVIANILQRLRTGDLITHYA